jgi:hypothetical protein
LMRFAPLTASYAITNFIAHSKRVTYWFKNTMEYLAQGSPGHPPFKIKKHLYTNIVISARIVRGALW